MFVSMGLSGLLPVIHGIYLYGFQEMRNIIGLDGVLVEAAFYLIGAVIYAVSTTIFLHENPKLMIIDSMAREHETWSIRHILEQPSTIPYSGSCGCAFTLIWNVVSL